MRLLISLFLFCSFLEAGVSSVDITPPHQNNDYMGIRILDQKRLSFDKIQGNRFVELSDLAYHAKTKILYIVSDKGKLFAFNAQFSSTIELLEPLSSTLLKNKKGKALGPGKEMVRG